MSSGEESNDLFRVTELGPGFDPKEPDVRSPTCRIKPQLFTMPIPKNMGTSWKSAPEEETGTNSVTPGVSSYAEDDQEKENQPPHQNINAVHLDI